MVDLEIQRNQITSRFQAGNVGNVTLGGVQVGEAQQILGRQRAGWFLQCLADGSVQGFSRSKLQEGLKNTGDAGTTAGGYAVGVNATPAGVNRLQFP